ncbi:MAG: hypothetical protein KDJ46_03135 [Rhodobiaceae bacterium]|nr:hypothetical protein [Rhodobiaceae bacterium]
MPITISAAITQNDNVEGIAKKGHRSRLVQIDDHDGGKGAVEGDRHKCAKDMRGLAGIAKGCICDQGLAAFHGGGKRLGKSRCRGQPIEIPMGENSVASDQCHSRVKNRIAMDDPDMPAGMEASRILAAKQCSHLRLGRCLFQPGKLGEPRH